MKLFSTCGPSLRPRPLEADIRVRASSDSASRHREVSSEKVQEAFLGVSGVTVVSDPEANSDAMVFGSSMGQAAAVSAALMGMLRRRFLLRQTSGQIPKLGPVAGPNEAVSASLMGKLAVHDSSLAKGLRRVLGFFWPEVLAVKRGCFLLGQSRPLWVWIWIRFWIWV